MNKYISKYKFLLIIIILVFSSFGFNSTSLNESEDAEITVNITQIDTSDFPTITLYVSVLDKNGEPYGIDPGQLVVEEDGRIINLDQMEGIGNVGGLTTMLVFDVSGSMNSAGKLESAKKVAIEYINKMRSGDRAGLVVFNTDIRYLQPITTSVEELISAINNITAESDTAMYDALYESVDILEPITGRKAIIALTDGLDNMSSNDPEDVINNIGPSGLSISTIGLGVAGQGSGALSALDEETLQEIASMAGGRYGFAENIDELSAIYELYGRSLQSEYVITYLSPSELRDGVTRKISVRLLDPGGVTGTENIELDYNPGGLVPEVSTPAPWPIFVGVMALLVILFVLPIVIINTSQSKKKVNRIKFASNKQKKKPNIKFK